MSRVTVGSNQQPHSALWPPAIPSVFLSLSPVWEKGHSSVCCSTDTVSRTRLPRSGHSGFPPFCPWMVRAEGPVLHASTGQKGESDAGAGPVFGNAAAQTIIAKYRKLSMKCKDEGSPVQDKSLLMCLYTDQLYT